MLLDVKFFVKNALKKNEESGNLEGMAFRRHKFYDMLLSLIAFVLILGSGDISQAGNDPGGLKNSQQAKMAPVMDAKTIISNLLNSPKSKMASNDPGIMSSVSFSAHEAELGNIRKECALEVWLSGEDWQNVSIPCQDVIDQMESAPVSYWEI